MGRKGKFSEGLLDDEKILGVLGIRPGWIVLDAGCGNGYMAKKFLKYVGDTGKVYALDPGETFIADLKEDVENTGVEAFVSDITQPTRIKGGSIDLLYLSNVFHIFSDRQVAGFIAEAGRILKPGAILAVVNIHKRETPFGPPLQMRSSPEELRQKLPFAPGSLLEVGEHFYMHLFENR